MAERRWACAHGLRGHRPPGDRRLRVDGLVGRASSAFSLHPGDVVDTRRFENPDGSGDLYFLGDGDDQWLPLGFLEVPQVGLVEALARETLIDAERDWWKFGTAGARAETTIVESTVRFQVPREADPHERQPSQQLSRNCTTPPGRAWSARGAKGPSRRSTSTRCST